MPRIYKEPMPASLEMEVDNLNKKTRLHKLDRKALSAYIGLFSKVTEGVSITSYYKTATEEDKWLLMWANEREASKNGTSDLNDE